MHASEAVCKAAVDAKRDLEPSFASQKEDVLVGERRADDTGRRKVNPAAPSSPAGARAPGLCPLTALSATAICRLGPELWPQDPALWVFDEDSCPENAGPSSCPGTRRPR